MKYRVEVIPDILCKTTEDFEEKIKLVESLSDKVHIDIADGRFVPNRTINIEEVLSVPTKLYEILHLMVEEPRKVVEKIPPESEVKEVIFHDKAENSPYEFIELAKNKGLKFAVAIESEAEFAYFAPFVEELSYILVMSIVPGFAGQNFKKDSLKLIHALKTTFPSLKIAVDGGMNPESVRMVTKSGASIIFSNSYIIRAPDKKEALASLQEAGQVQV